MFTSIRSALLIVAVLSASSVGPARAGPNSEPLLSMNSAAIPEVISPQALVVEDTVPEVPGEIETTPLPEQQQAVPRSVRPSGSLSSLVAQMRGSDPGSRELECLAIGVYFESKSEPLAGQLAVARVIANRANSRGRFPGSYCGVLFQRSQFSFVRGRSVPSVPRSSRQWQTAVAIAKIADQDLQQSSVGNAMFFHARRVSPGWRLKRVAAIGNHIFYR